jgi:hypothetical protein
MVIEVVDNHGVTNMSAELTRGLANCTTARLATASLTRDGMAAIENAFSVARSRFKVKLLVGGESRQEFPFSLEGLSVQ